MLFGTSGIRGIYGKDITEELAYKVANVFAEKNVVIARDTRQSGKSLETACISGVVARWKTAHRLEIAPTPTLALATIKHDCLGIMITASHNPEEYNGFKLFKNGKELSRRDEREFEERFNKTKIDSVNKPFAMDPGYISFSGTDKVKIISAIEDHKSMIKKMVDCDAIAKRKPKVVVDCNGAAAAITPYLLRELGCHVISMNAEMEGFNRPSEPNAENLQATTKIVKAIGADLGIAHDGDGDRCVVIDETGEILPLDIQLAIMIENELSCWTNISALCLDELAGSKRQETRNLKPKTSSPNPIIISTIEASLLIREICEKNSAEIKITPVSSVHISQELEKSNALFGGEPCGEYVFGNAEHHAPDGVLAAAKFVEIFTTRGKLSELKMKYRQYPMLREKFKCEESKFDKVKKIAKMVEIKGERNEEDGLRIDEEDGWFLIRASGTEPIIRLTMEYKNKKKIEKRAEELREIIKNCL